MSNLAGYQPSTVRFANLLRMSDPMNRDAIAKLPKQTRALCVKTVAEISINVGSAYSLSNTPRKTQCIFSHRLYESLSWYGQAVGTYRQLAATAAVPQMPQPQRNLEQRRRPELFVAAGTRTARTFC